MPRSSGLRLIRELREHNFSIPVIAISGWAADQLDLAHEYGADFILFKPLDGDEHGSKSPATEGGKTPGSLAALGLNGSPRAR
jgi:CheY-like chemotaxis protein